MDPVPEGEVRGRAPDLETERLLEAALIVVRRDVRDLHAVAFADVRAAKLDVLGRRAVHGVNGRGHAEHLFDDRWDDRRVLARGGEELWIARELEGGGRDEAGRGFVAREEDLQEHVDEFGDPEGRSQSRR